MELVFEGKRVFDEGLLMQFAHEPSGLLSQYFGKTNRVYNKSTKNSIDNGDADYNAVEYLSEANRLTTNAVSKFGIKTFPQFGAYGFYTTLHSNVNKVLFPINAERAIDEAPSFVLLQEAASILITITDPSSPSYDCYRVMFRQGNFAEEFVSYDKIFSASLLGAGTYDVTIIGFSTDDDTHSVESDVVEYVET